MSLLGHFAMQDGLATADDLPDAVGIIPVGRVLRLIMLDLLALTRVCVREGGASLVPQHLAVGRGFSRRSSNVPPGPGLHTTAARHLVVRAGDRRRYTLPRSTTVIMVLLCREGEAAPRVTRGAAS